MMTTLLEAPALASGLTLMIDGPDEATASFSASAGGLTGFVSSADLVRQQAQERYLTAVAPNILH